MIPGIVIAAHHLIPERAVAAPRHAVVGRQLAGPLSLVEEQRRGEDRAVVILGGMVGMVSGSSFCGGCWRWGRSTCRRLGG
jgi:hypothetical protein